MKQNVKLIMSSSFEQQEIDLIWRQPEDVFGGPPCTVWSKSYTMNVLHSRPASSRDFIEQRGASISNSNFLSCGDTLSWRIVWRNMLSIRRFAEAFIETTSIVEGDNPARRGKRNHRRGKSCALRKTWPWPWYMKLIIYLLSIEIGECRTPHSLLILPWPWTFFDECLAFKKLASSNRTHTKYNFTTYIFRMNLISIQISNPWRVFQ